MSYYKLFYLFFLVSYINLNAQLRTFEMDMAPEDSEVSNDYISETIIEDDKYTFMANTNCDQNTVFCLAFCQISKDGKLLNFKKYKIGRSFYSQHANNFIRNPDGTYLVGANIYESLYDRVPVLMKLDKNLDTLWTKTYRVNNNLIDDIRGIGVMNNGDIVLGIYGGTSNFQDIGVIRTDSMGNLKWVKNSGFRSNYFTVGLQKMNLLSNGNLLVSFFAGAYDNTQGKTDGNNFAILDSMGKVIVDHRITKNLGSIPFILPISDTTYFYACETDTFLHGNLGNQIHGIINNNGEKLYEYSFPSPELRQISAITKSTAGDLYLFGLRDDWKYGTRSYWFSKHDSLGKLMWERTYLEKSRMFSNMAGFLDLDVDIDGSILLSGAIRDTVQFHGIRKQNAFMMRFDKDGCYYQDSCDNIFFLTGIKYNNIISNAQIFIYPNPVIDNLIVYLNNEDLQDRRYQIKCFDQNGKIVLTSEISGRKTNIDVNLLVAGMYFYQINDRFKNIQYGKFIKL
ncbi:MAG: T9SS type A sorting domain-containing protein [Ignavibacterium sp.]|jgi:hypothetical protein|nr:T9SS type A sorting domain-containing protein [Ignavibacterium sp.]MBV6473836.1 hypothetical protein [Saprospiraceae bacterium]